MTAQPTEKDVRKYSAMYREGLKAMALSAPEEKMAHYTSKLREMYSSPQFKAHNIYPTMDVIGIYAVITMCMELRSYGLSNDEIMSFVDAAFKKRRAFFDTLIKLVNLLPNSFQIAKMMNTPTVICLGLSFQELRLLALEMNSVILKWNCFEQQFQRPFEAAMRQLVAVFFMQ